MIADIAKHRREPLQWSPGWKPGDPYAVEQVRTGPDYVALIRARGGRATIAQLAKDAGVSNRKCAGRMRDLERDGKVRFVGVGSVALCG